MNHPVPDAAFSETVAVLGRTGSGKTFAAKGAAERMLAAGQRVCIIDPTGVWYGLKSSADGKSAGFPIAVFGGTHADVAITEESAEPLAELIGTRNLPAIVDIAELSRSGQTRFMTRFLDALYARNRQPLTIVFDEADLYCPQRPMPDQMVLLNRMEQIVRRGRVRGFKPWLITQRPAELHKSVLSQASTLIAMRLTSPQDRDAIGAWIEGQADREEGKRVLATLPKLPPGEGFVWCPAIDYLERVKFPAITTFDSGRTPEHGEAAQQPAKLADVDLSGVMEALQPKQADRGEALVTSSAQRQRERDAHEKGRREGYEAALQAVRLALDMPLVRLAETLQGVREDLDKVAPHARDTDANNSPHNVHKPAPAAAAPRPPKPAAPRVNGSTGTLSKKAERLILSVLAQYPHGRTKNQVAILAGYAVNGGGFSNAVSALRTQGYLEGDAARLVITAAGLNALGPYEPLPHGRALLDHWCGQLSKAERKALETLAEVFPRTLSKAQLAARAGYEANGGGFNNALSRLRTLELISGKAEIRASQDLFDDGR